MPRNCYQVDEEPSQWIDIEQDEIDQINEDLAMEEGED